MNTLITYTRNPRNNQLNGCVVAVGDCDTGFRVGWSLCRKNDTFSKETARNIAIARACKGSVVPIPFSLHTEYDAMVERGKRYFKTKPIDID